MVTFLAPDLPAGFIGGDAPDDGILGFGDINFDLPLLVYVPLLILEGVESHGFCHLINLSNNY